MTAADFAPPLTTLCPDFPFAYDDWLAHPAGLGELPPDRLGQEVAVVGGGIAGVVAAYELLRLGLKPVVYEAGQIGGRMRSIPLAGEDGAIAEMGAMRFPPSATTLYRYIDEVGLETKPFANPLSRSTSTTVINLDGVTYRARTPADLPSVFHEVDDAWHKALQELADLSTMRDAIRMRDTAMVKAIWNRLLPELDDQSFYGFLARSTAFASFRHREIFGQVGFGTGGWDTDFPNSVLEILRVIYTGVEEGPRQIIGGCQQLPRRLWNHAPASARFWPAGTSVASLHDGSPRPAVIGLRPAGDGFAVEDENGDVRTYPAVVFTAQHRVLLTKIAGVRPLLPANVWTALERTHYMGASKLFVPVDRPFWHDVDPRTGEELMGMTLTDRTPRSVYLFDDGPDSPAALCLSYTWNDDSLKFATLGPAERLELALDALADIYPGVDIRSHITGDPVTVTWENEPNFQGAFKANLPGQYRYQRRLFTHFRQDDLPAAQRGLFLAGDDISWMGGFAEGAVTSALNAVWGTLRHLGGATDPRNPGPGDVFDHIAPIELPES
ncbi:lysine monooxygenase [Amycolatopsis japonica]|uniref:Lysine monooxygenase n=1 Tax=Amycolatopsis japonica TaxID=208439 RepID=A0A075UMH8_9PSEU|nr:NAD(P)/FAD-dependent oxidoreductase [Amycolatopsis japonica]AIG75352.1 lysine monooxygenase [Amycolatopsis japonica]